MNESRSFSPWLRWLLALSLSLLLPAMAHAQDGKIEVLWLGQAATRIKTVTGKQEHRLLGELAPRPGVHP